MKNKPMVWMLTAITFAGVIAVSSCTHKNDVVPAVSFHTDILPVLRASCAVGSDCHTSASNANGHINFTDSVAYTTIVTKGLINISAPAGSMLYSEVHSGLMPKAPYGPLPGSEVTLILNWIKGGGKDN
jgi:hypothetical protein